MGGQPGFVGERDPHSHRVEVGVFGGDRLDPFVDDLDQPGSRFDVQVGVSKMAQYPSRTSDSSTVAALDAVTTTYRAKEKRVEIIGRQQD